MSEGASLNDLSTKWIIFSIFLGGIGLFSLGYFGMNAQGRIASFAITSVAITMRATWPLKSRLWFWPLFFAIFCAHIAIIFAIHWPDPHYPAIILAPFALIDISAMIYLFIFIDRHLQNGRAPSDS